MTEQKIQELVKRAQTLVMPHEYHAWKNTHEPYYRFMHLLSKELPWDANIVELGCDHGTGIIHLAGGRPANAVPVYSVDMKMDRAWATVPFWLARHRRNICLMQGDSIKMSPHLPCPIDLLFIDTLHECERLMMEFNHYYPRMKDEGIILFDDIHQNDSMVEGWQKIKSFGADMGIKTLDFDSLHWTGFGVALLPGGEYWTTK